MEVPPCNKIHKTDQKYQKHKNIRKTQKNPEKFLTINNNKLNLCLIFGIFRSCIQGDIEFPADTGIILMPENANNSKNPIKI